MKGEVEEGERSRGCRGRGEAGRAGRGSGLGGRARARKECGGGLVEIEERLGRERGARFGSEYSRCYARGYTYIYGRWCMVCHDGSNSAIPGLKLTSQ